MQSDRTHTGAIEIALRRRTAARPASCPHLDELRAPRTALLPDDRSCRTSGGSAREGRGSIAVARRLEDESLAVSPFVVLELTVADVSAEAVCSAALALAWTRDPFDRLIDVHAVVGDLPLGTKDETMRTHLPQAWWG
jgi:hypothetical protein